MAESPVTVNVREGEVQGQAQVQSREPHDGVHKVYEAVVVTDHVVTDANSDLAVQVPEGVGASTYGHRSPLGEALRIGTPEQQFGNGEVEADEPEEEDSDES